MENKTANVDVCIVGAGPSGALIGYLLAKKGVKTMVIEQTSGNTPPFRGEHITAETEAILKELQLFEKIEEKGLLRMEKVEFIDQGRVIKSIAPKEDEEHVGIHVPQSHLISTIIEEANQYEHFNLMVNTRGTALVQNEEGFYCGVKAMTGNEEWTINSSIVIGADGRFSTVRKLAYIPYEIIQHGYDVLWAKIPAPAGWEPTVRLLLTNGHQLALFTQTGGFIQIGWNIPEGSYSEIKNLPLEPFLKPLQENFPELRDTLKDHLSSWKDMILLEVFSSKSATWVRDGLVIIGDAAHTMTPTDAIGINTGMKDAYVLAPIIEDALENHLVNKEILREFELLRRKEVESLQKAQIHEEQSYVSIFE